MSSVSQKYTSLIGLLLWGLVLNVSATEIIAHRGASSLAPENTLTAVILGFRQSADAVELDVHLTKDGEIVVIHDPNTRRTSGQDRLVQKTNLAELRSLQVGKWGPWLGQGFHEQIPVLSEALALVPKDKKLFIEIKVGTEIFPSLRQTLRTAALNAEQTILIGFDYLTMKAAKQEFPELKVQWLVNYNRDARGYYPTAAWLAEHASTAKFDAVSLHYEWPINGNFVGQLKMAGLKVYTWTVDDVSLARRHIAAGVDGITTNRPGRLRDQLSQQPL